MFTLLPACENCTLEPCFNTKREHSVGPAGPKTGVLHLPFYTNPSSAEAGTEMNFKQIYNPYKFKLM